MARPKGTLDEDLTRKLTWMVDLLRMAAAAGTPMKVREAATLVVQAAQDEPDMLRAIAAGRAALPNQKFESFEPLVTEAIARHEDRRTAGKIVRKRKKPGAAVHKRAAGVRTATLQSAVAAANDERARRRDVSPKAEARADAAAVDALLRAYRARGREIVTMDINDLGWRETPRYFPSF